jgi:hypothetical protein
VQGSAQFLPCLRNNRGHNEKRSQGLNIPRPVVAKCLIESTDFGNWSRTGARPTSPLRKESFTCHTLFGVESFGALECGLAILWTADHISLDCSPTFRYSESTEKPSGGCVGAMARFFYTKNSLNVHQNNIFLFRFLKRFARSFCRNIYF